MVRPQEQRIRGFYRLILVVVVPIGCRGGGIAVDLYRVGTPVGILVGKRDDMVGGRADGLECYVADAGVVYLSGAIDAELDLARPSSVCTQHVRPGVGIRLAVHVHLELGLRVLTRNESGVHVCTEGFGLDPGHFFVVGVVNRRAIDEEKAEERAGGDCRSRERVRAACRARRDRSEWKALVRVPGNEAFAAVLASECDDERLLRGERYAGELERDGAGFCIERRERHRAPGEDGLRHAARRERYAVRHDDAVAERTGAAGFAEQFAAFLVVEIRDAVLDHGDEIELDRAVGSRQLEAV